VNRRLSKTLDVMGSSSDISTRTGAERGSRTRPADGGGRAKKSLAMTLAVKWEGAEGTQEDSL
jgi:hypothetical protein